MGRLKSLSARVFRNHRRRAGLHARPCLVRAEILRAVLDSEGQWLHPGRFVHFTFEHRRAVSSLPVHGPGIRAARDRVGLQLDD